MLLRPVLYFVLLAHALVAVGISLAILKSLHHSILLYLLFIPVWSSLLLVLASVARVAFKGAPSGHSQ